MTSLITTAAVLIAIFLIVVAIRVFQREKPILYVLIPVILLFALSSGYAINELLGYATTNLRDLQKEFVYLAHAGQDPVYLLAVPQGSPEPRLYAIPRDQLSDQSRRGLNETGQKSKQGIHMLGRFQEGEFRSYRFDAERLPPKAAE